MSFLSSIQTLWRYLVVIWRYIVVKDPPIQKVAPQIMYPPLCSLLSFLWIFAKLTGGAQFRQIAVFATLPVLEFDKLKGSPPLSSPWVAEAGGGMCKKRGRNPRGKEREERQQVRCHYAGDKGGGKQRELNCHSASLPPSVSAATCANRAAFSFSA